MPQPHPVTCARCGRAFIAIRADARTCSTACRVAMSAKRRNDATDALTAELAPLTQALTTATKVGNTAGVLDAASALRERLSLDDAPRLLDPTLHGLLIAAASGVVAAHSD